MLAQLLLGSVVKNVLGGEIAVVSVADALFVFFFLNITSYQFNVELVEPQLNYTYTGMDEDNGNIQ